MLSFIDSSLMPIEKKTKYKGLEFTAAECCGIVHCSQLIKATGTQRSDEFALTGNTNNSKLNHEQFGNDKIYLINEQ